MGEEERQAMLRFRRDHPLAFELIGLSWLALVVGILVAALLIAIV